MMSTIYIYICFNNIIYIYIQNLHVFLGFHDHSFGGEV